MMPIELLAQAAFAGGCVYWLSHPEMDLVGATTSLLWVLPRAEGPPEQQLSPQGHRPTSRRAPSYERDWGSPVADLRRTRFHTGMPDGTSSIVSAITGYADERVHAIVVDGQELVVVSSLSGAFVWAGFTSVSWEPTVKTVLVDGQSVALPPLLAISAPG
jgi:hypothetical protein